MVVALSISAGCGIRAGPDGGTDNQPPVADAGDDQTGAPGQALAFDGSASTDPDGEITSFEWSFGDGAEGSGEAVSHPYANSGIYSVVLTVTDDGEAVDSDTISVTIEQTGPVAEFSFAPNPAYVGETVSFDASASTAETSIASYSWDFGDSTDEAVGATVSHSYDFAGTFKVTLSIEVEPGSTAETSKWVEVRASGLTLTDIIGTYDVTADPTSRDCTSYSVTFVDTVLALSEGAGDGTCSPDVPIDGASGSGRVFHGCWEESHLGLTYDEASAHPGGSCTADLTAAFSIDFDTAGHFTGNASSFFDAGIGCQCTALFSVEGTRR